jgi:hypothetical protein
MRFRSSHLMATGIAVRLAGWLVSAGHGIVDDASVAKMRPIAPTMLMRDRSARVSISVEDGWRGTV